MIECSENLDSVEYKKWMLQKLNTSKTSTMDYDSTILITEYAPTKFQDIRNENHISNCYLRDLFESEETDEIRKHIGNPGGVSGCFFYATSDKRFIMKTLKKDEK